MEKILVVTFVTVILILTAWILLVERVAKDERNLPANAKTTLHDKVVHPTQKSSVRRKTTGFFRPVGTILEKSDLSPIADPPNINKERAKLPAVFNEWMKLGWLSPIKDQQQCGGCWAFAVTSVLADRITNASGGRVKLNLSPEYMISCFQDEQMGCEGGLPHEAFHQLQREGVPTNEAVPYSGAQESCPVLGPNVKKYKAIAGYSVTQNGEIYGLSPQVLSQKQIDYNVTRMKVDIFLRGPIVGIFLVYSDLMNYEPGTVYKPDPASGVVGGHAVRIVGWHDADENNPDPYWIIANSWGTGWGINGFFKMIMGRNAAYIETNSSACFPDMAGIDLVGPPTSDDSPESRALDKLITG